MTEDIHYSIIKAIADEEGVEPKELDLELYRYTDVDALCDLYRCGSNNPRVDLRIDGYLLTITDNGRIQITRDTRSTATDN